MDNRPTTIQPTGKADDNRNTDKDNRPTAKIPTGVIDR